MSTLVTRGVAHVHGLLRLRDLAPELAAAVID
jgi:hypothetical protein